jgi:hypothetical protein
MFQRDNYPRNGLPVYDVQELSMEEALLVLAAEREFLSHRIEPGAGRHALSHLSGSGMPAEIPAA